MKRTFLILCALCFLCLCGCGVVNTLQNDEGLRLYYPRVLTGADGGDAVVYVTIPWEELPQEDTQEQAQTVLALLLGGCRDENFRSPVPAGTQLNACMVQGTTALVDFTGSYGQLDGMDLTLADYCITLSLTQLKDIYAVRITVGGQDLAYRDTSRFLASDVLVTSTEDVVRTLTAKLYFPDSEGTLCPEDRLLTLYEGESRAGVVLSALANGPDKAGHKPLWTGDFMPQVVRTEEGECYVNLSGENLNILQENVDTVLQGITASLCSVEGVNGVQFLVDGEYQMTLGTTDISGALTTAE